MSFLCRVTHWRFWTPTSRRCASGSICHLLRNNLALCKPQTGYALESGAFHLIILIYQRKFEGLTSELRILEHLFATTRSHSQKISQPRDLTAKGSHSQGVSQPRDLTAKRSHSQEISQPRDLTAKRSHSQEISQPRDLTAKRSHSQEIS